MSERSANQGRADEQDWRRARAEPETCVNCGGSIRLSKRTHGKGATWIHDSEFADCDEPHATADGTVIHIRRDEEEA